jgi:hypothetical protein
LFKAAVGGPSAASFGPDLLKASIALYVFFEDPSSMATELAVEAGLEQAVELAGGYDENLTGLAGGNALQAFKANAFFLPCG